MGAGSGYTLHSRSKGDYARSRGTPRADTRIHRCWAPEVWKRTFVQERDTVHCHYKPLLPDLATNDLQVFETISAWAQNYLD